MTSFAANSERNNVSTHGVQLPFGNGLTGVSKAGEEGLGAETAPQGRPAEVVGDNEMAVNIFDSGRPLDKYSRVQVSPHSSHSPLNVPERFESAPQKLNADNTAADLTFVKGGPFLPTAFFLRPVEEQFRILAAVTNDNWHPLGAA